jgi:nucleoside-diphosphate-sugar epimerase
MAEGVLGGAVTDRVHCYASDRSLIALRSGRSIECQPLSELPKAPIGPHLLAHCAFKTPENEAITELVLQHASLSEVCGFFIPSSGAVYNVDRTLTSDFSGNPYGALKAVDESRFADIANNAGRTAVIRVFNLSGPFLNKPTLYALGSILGDIERGGPIHLRADHPVIRSYVHVRDLVDIAFAIMLGIVSGPAEPFDTAGDREVEVEDLASLAAATLGCAGMPIQRPKIRSDVPPDRYVGSGATMAGLAAAYSYRLSTLEEQIVDTATYLRASGRR